MTRKKLVSTIAAMLIIFNSTNALAVVDELGCAMVMCVYGVKYGGGDAEECSDPLDTYHKIQKFSGTFSKKLDCVKTVNERKAVMEAACQENTWPLDDIVDCATE